MNATAARPASKPAPRVRLEQVPTSTPVFYHEPEMKPIRQARMGFVAGPGAQPDRWNISVLCDPFQDVTEGRRAPIVGRRNVPVYGTYPPDGSFPQEPFAVINTLLVHMTLAALQTPAEEPEPELEPAARDDNVDVLAKTKPVTPEVQTAADQDEARAKPPRRKPVEEPAPPENRNGQAKGPAKAEVAALSKLFDHPAWERENEDSKARIAQNENGLEFRSVHGVLTARLRYRHAGASQGYELWVPSRVGRGVAPLVQKANTPKEVARVIKLAARISRKGAELLKPGAELQKIISKVVKQYENPEAPPDDDVEQPAGRGRISRRVVPEPGPDGPGPDDSQDPDDRVPPGED